MYSFINTHPIFTEPPSYIQEILKSSEHIYLVYHKMNKKVSNDEESDNRCKLEDTDMTFDLTGNPLEVNLSDTSLITPEEDILLQEEPNHCPIPLNSARKIINLFNRKLLGKDSSYIFCICDGTDKKHTVALGACQTSEFLCRLEIYNKGCYKQKDVLISLENMKQEHLDSIGISNGQVKSLIIATYTIYGNNLKNIKISNTMPISACISYNVSWNAYQYEVPGFVGSAEMIVQTVIGHVESKMFPCWEQLLLLQTYAKILETGQTDLENVNLVVDSKNYMEITKEICHLVDEVQARRRIPSKINEKDNFNIEHLRQENLIDGLWNLLISCKNIRELKICFHFLFEELILKEFLKPIITNANKSVIAIIINDISCGKLAVPTLSFSEALEYLIELGIEKLKHDYCCILNHFNCLNYQDFEKYWSSLSTEHNVHDRHDRHNNLTKSDVNRVTFGRLPTTIQRTSLIGDSKIPKKISYLQKMHIACELLIVSDKVKLPTQESFNALIKSIDEHVLNVDNIALLKNISQCMLQEINVKLQSNDVKFLQSKDPVKWNVKLVSAYDRSTVTTIFHHSLKPIFPSCICNKYDVPINDDGEETNYYVAKVVKFAEKI